MRPGLTEVQSTLVIVDSSISKNMSFFLNNPQSKLKILNWHEISQYLDSLYQEIPLLQDLILLLLFRVESCSIGFVCG